MILKSTRTLDQRSKSHELELISAKYCVNCSNVHLVPFTSVVVANGTMSSDDDGDGCYGGGEEEDYAHTDRRNDTRTEESHSLRVAYEKFEPIHVSRKHSDKSE